MSEPSSKPVNVVLCGRGRLGGRIAECLTSQGIDVLGARIDRERGLVFCDQAQIADISTLIICIAPRKNGGSAWPGLLESMEAQVQCGRLSVGLVIHVSSTVVYDGYENGWVDASSPVRAVTERSRGVLNAEEAVRRLASNTLILRLAGLVGKGYQRYDPVEMSLDKPRHAVSVEQAATLIGQQVNTRSEGARTALITDGCVYYRKLRYRADRNDPFLANLASRHRLLLPGCDSRKPTARESITAAEI